MKHILSLIVVILPILGISQSLEYPIAEKQTVVDTFYQTPVYDDYRWLEDANNEKTKNWIEHENDLTNKTLRKEGWSFNSKIAIDKYSYTRYDNPIKQRDYYFTYAYYNDVSNPALFYKKFMRDQFTVLVDPSFISAKDNIILKTHSVSMDSKYLAYSFGRNGSDWSEIMVVNLKTGVFKKDHLENIKFSDIAWRGDGFYYSKYPQQGLEQTTGQEVYYHQLDTDQSEDKLIFRRQNNPTAEFAAYTTSDERFLIIHETDKVNELYNIFYIDFNEANPAIKPLLTRLKFGENLNVLDNQGDELIAKTFKGNNNGMIVKINPASPREWKTVVPEFSVALLTEVKLLNDRFIAIYQVNRKQQIIFFDYDGKVLHSILLPFGFSANGFNGEKTDKKLLFSYSGYTQPKTVYVFDTETFDMEPLGSTIVNYDYTQFETKELEYESKDGTVVPLFLVYKKGIELMGNNPTLLNAYGGFGAIERPSFDPGIVHFLLNDGIFAYANIRGGGDNGKNWALDGRGTKKQNSFDDFIAAAEYLINNKYTSPDKLAITGGSNGGLVVGVAMTQRPELFKVAVPVVGPMDMIRFENFTIGHFHANEYGTVKDTTGFNNLLAYSPLHNIREDVNYPATLIMTSENDDRVPPFHSYKFAARLQNRKAQKNPILLRVEKGAGHYGAEGNFLRILKEKADMYDFILYNLMKN